MHIHPRELGSGRHECRGEVDRRSAALDPGRVNDGSGSKRRRRDRFPPPVRDALLERCEHHGRGDPL